MISKLYPALRFSGTLVLFGFLSSQTLIARETTANRQELAYSPKWLRLLHYQKGLNGLQSRIDSPEFFLDKNGKHDPASELEATIKATTTPDSLQRVTCRYPARVKFLIAHFDPSIPFNICPELKFWSQTLAAEAVSVLYASQYSGNPASRFGHTFLRFGKNQVFGPQVIKATDPVVSFAARTGEVGSFDYAWKGLFGGFKAYYSVGTFSQKLQEYNNLENRDIWEYQLKLNPSEIETLVYHLYELRLAWWEYWFTLENCSYQLLTVLEVAREDLNLVKNFNYYAIPLDTINALRQSDVVSNVLYHPSLGTTLEGHLNRFNNAQISTFKRTLKTGAIDTPEDPEILNALIYYSDYQQSKDRLYQPKLESLKLQAMRLRAQLPREKNPVTVATPKNPPHVATPITLVEGGVRGVRGEEKNQGYLRFRPLMRDLMISDRGQTENEEMAFFDTTLKINRDRGSLDLHHLKFFSNIVIRPVTRYENHLSWDLALSIRKTREYEDVDQSYFRFDPKAGYAASKFLTWYAMISFLTDTHGGENFRFHGGPGLHLGAIFSSDYLKIHLVNKFYRMISHWDQSPYRQEVNLQSALYLDRQNQINLNLTRHQTSAVTYEYSLGLAFLFE